MDTERSCLACNQALGDDWARKDQKYCSESCKMMFWYREKYKKFYDDRYKKQKKAWERSPNGKRAGIPIRVWKNLPKDWQ